MDIGKIIREEVDKDWDFVNSVEPDYSLMTKDLLEKILNDNDKTVIYWHDGDEYTMSLNNGDCESEGPFETTISMEPIIISWDRMGGGCYGNTYEGLLDQFKEGLWSLEDPHIENGY
jgi:hypothetical protein